MANAFFDAPPELMGLPTARAAYSDRTAWMMSEMSELAYLLFEKPDGRSALKEALGKAGFELAETFNKKDTQAFLAIREADKAAVLAFRGAEATKWRDLKSDLDARFYKSESGARIYRGFAKAYEQVGEQVNRAAEALPKGHALYVTGHSLGGALATIAARALEATMRDALAACYTFGSPRVGGAEFGYEIRCPVYRIVNAADGVPRVPFGFMGYRHVGDLRYLTACGPDFRALRVIPNLPMSLRGYRLVRRCLARGWSVLAKDHSISQYSGKLKHYAQQRAKA